MNETIWGIIKTLYAQIFRPLLKKAIDNPDEVWDDWVLKICDNIFEYNG